MELQPITATVRPASHREGKRAGQQIVTVNLPNGGYLNLIISKTGRNVQVFSGDRFKGEFSTRLSDFQ